MQALDQIHTYPTACRSALNKEVSTTNNENMDRTAAILPRKISSLYAFVLRKKKCLSLSCYQLLFLFTVVLVHF